MKRSRSYHLAFGLGVVVAFALQWTEWAAAQNPNLNPKHGSASLKAGFVPDPFTKKVLAGGLIKTHLGGVTAHVADAPDFRLNYTAGGVPLVFRASSFGDTTLLIRLPNGQWIADDDGGAGVNPSITLHKPKSGTYHIWVGTFGLIPVPATLSISELGSPPPPPPGAGPDPSLPPSFGSVTLKAGFTPDPFIKALTAGGPIFTNYAGVNAYVGKAPDFRLHYTAGSYGLRFHVQSAADTTLLINLPNGKWIANDDASGSFNPSIVFSKPASGQYDVWVGTFGKAMAPATLFITEVTAAPPPPAGGPDPSLNPTFGSVNLSIGFMPDPFIKKLTAGGPISTKIGGVNAHVAKAPDFRLHYKAGLSPLMIQAKSSADTTLLVNLPNGQWIANDDFGGSLNPSIYLAKPQSGQYDIWVGTVGSGLPQATLYITEVTPPPPSTGGPDPSLNPTYGSIALKHGFMPDPFSKAVTAGGGIVSKLGGVTAHVAKAPDFRLNYTAGAFPLTFHVQSAADTTLLINLPNGQWIANDDGGGFPNPMIKLATPMSGQYDIWVGTVGTGLPPATLHITELK